MKPDFLQEDCFLFSILDALDSDKPESHRDWMLTYAKWLRRHGEKLVAEILRRGCLQFIRCEDPFGNIGYRCAVKHPSTSYSYWVQLSQGSALLNEHEREMPMLSRMARVCEMIEARKYAKKSG